MARKHKGKSKRRVKNWQVRYAAGEHVEDAANREKLSRQEVKLREDRFALSTDETPDDWTQVAGQVTGMFRRGVFVRVEGKDLYCGIAKTFRPPATPDQAYDVIASTPLTVGDEVTLGLTPQEHTQGQTHLDRNRMDGMVLSRRERTCALARPMPISSKRREDHETSPLKVIVANFDTLLIVASIQSPPLKPGVIDRFLIAAERGQMKSVVVINKIDLATPDDEFLEELRRCGVKVICSSAETGEGVEAVRAQLAGKKSVLAGLSGVGKSTLVNALLPGTDAVTREVREKDQRGRHTTSQSRVYDLPEGGQLVDTPGIREIAIHMEPAELTWYFPEFLDIAPNCRFRNCTHTHEPGCAIQAAVESGDLTQDRYNRYLRILDTL
jgi:ribosome small subunit-dependent GTPase A